ncbi:CAP-associated domain-containing protein [Enterococcus sp. AZ126]|uniref:CAP-associated domain-containing protein n=1 Tax=Enterococcus sp. AZ126 TaxID=2774635 RepID=UPI003F22B609
MKRFLAFVGVFLVVLIGGYLQPVFFPAEKMQQKAESGRQDISHTALPYEEISTSGYAAYIGEKTDDFVKVFGEPIEKLNTAMGYELWIYGEKDADYLEMNVQNEKISAIKAFNDSKETKPFSIGMKLSDVSELMTIYSNFAFTYKESNYDVELMEEDMNYRPLIAFDNKTFAILFFNHGTGKLSAVTYLDKKTLLTLMPYQLIEGEVVPFFITEQTSGFDAIRSNQIIRTINLLKLEEDLPSYRVNTESQKNAQKLFDTLNKNQKNIFSLERAEIWQYSKEQMMATASFTLTNDEYQKLLKIAQLDKKKATGMYTEPVYDSTFTVLSWFSDSLYYSRFAHQENENIGVAFSKASMLVLLQESEKEISQTEESE